MVYSKISNFIVSGCWHWNWESFFLYILYRYTNAKTMTILKDSNFFRNLNISKITHIQNISGFSRYFFQKRYVYNVSVSLFNYTGFYVNNHWNFFKLNINRDMCFFWSNDPINHLMLFVYLKKTLITCVCLFFTVT